MNLAQIDFQQLRIKHLLFKSKVRSVLYGGNFDRSFFSENGPVGVWLSKVGQPKYGNQPEMLQLIRLHNELISIALKLIALYNEGKIDQAHDGLKNIEKYSETFQEILERLEQKL